ncbi:hypothetical protein ACFL20_13360 [Spirochaetota bacterium]
MKLNKLLIITIIFLSFSHLSAEDYQYDYFTIEKKKNKYVPFSDYIPRIRHHYKTVPHFLEDYYELYGMKQYYNENTLRRNIARLKTALNCRFRHPSMALVKVETEIEYRKYRNLLFMHINLLIMRNYLKIGARYDKRKIYFFNADFAKEINESLDIAESFYKEAMPYWVKAKKYANNASKFRITTDLGKMESERYSIIQGELDYNKIINFHLRNLSKKKNKLKDILTKQQK